MKQTLTFLITLFVTNLSIGQSTYIGTEKICMQQTKKDSCDNSDNENSKWKWYHLSILKIKGDSVFLDQSPISIYKKDTSYSASDGAFFYYRGTISKITDTTFTINLTEIYCDYCATRFKKLPDGSRERIYRTKTFSCRQTNDGFWANEIFFKRTAVSETLTSENPKHK